MMRLCAAHVGVVCLWSCLCKTAVRSISRHTAACQCRQGVALRICKAPSRDFNLDTFVLISTSAQHAHCAHDGLFISAVRRSQHIAVRGFPADVSGGRAATGAAGTLLEAGRQA